MSPAGNQMPEPEGEKPPAILIVEDDVLLRFSTADQLREAGLHVVEAANGDEAKAVLEAGVGVDLIFSDINFEGEVDGVGLAQWSANHYPDVPVVLTSGMQHALNTAQAACPFVKGFVLKPYDFAALLKRFTALLALRAKHG
jgi:DNA-binding NtrC family response regulator